MQQQEGYPSTTHLQKGRNRRGTYQGAWNFTKAFLLPLLLSNVSRVSSVAPPASTTGADKTANAAADDTIFMAALFICGTLDVVKMT
jgi:hypothetical protein